MFIASILLFVVPSAPTEIEIARAQFYKDNSLNHRSQLALATSKRFSSLSDHDKLSYSVLDFVNSRLSNSSFSTFNARMNQLKDSWQTNRSLTAEEFGAASEALSNYYVKTKAIHFLEAAVSVPLDGAYAEYCPLIAYKSLIKVNPLRTSSIACKRIINKIKRRLGEELSADLIPLSMKLKDPRDREIALRMVKSN